MRINTNMSALRSCYRLNSANNKLATSIERLSSGYKINSSEDNPVGAAMSQRMKTQLRGLDRAIQNASDGISVVETAEGALAEVVDMVQRIRELSIQGANDTMSAQDRQSLMDEVEMLKEEVDRISQDTEYNTRGLLNGELSRRSYTDLAGVSVNYISDSVESQKYTLRVYQEATYAQIGAAPTVDKDDVLGVEGTFTINGENVKIEAEDTLQSALEKIKDAADLSDISVNYDGSTITFVSDIPGSNYPIKINSTSELAEKLGIDVQMSADGTDAQVEADMTGTFKFPASTTIEVDGNNVTLSASGGFEMRVSIQEGSIGPRGEEVHITALDIGTMVIQMGANEGQIMDINIPEVSCSAMGIDKVNLHTEEGCNRAMDMCDDAIAYISRVRSKLGAYTNRMEHAVNSLEVSNENLTAALSRIEDTDMAEEMTTYTSQNVITQAANSMLAQANQLPEKVLQLLQ